ncbi:MAG TPA: protein-export chaperone SecB [Chromatiales bacterium]|nr:protein-export chaperone SecB [Chromatiales bacterium]
MAENENQQQNREFALQRIYTKDVSFETPNSPGVFQIDWQPQTNLNVNTNVDRLADDVFEVVLTVTVTTKVADKTAYLAEVQQAGIFGMRGFPEEEMGPMLGAFCPNVLFPYAREVISDLVSKGSFPQMLLQPVNFDALYAQAQQQRSEQAEEGEAKPH